MAHLALLFVAGGLGTLLRYWITGLVPALGPADEPGIAWGTLAVNVLGCLICGVLFGWMEARSIGGELRTVLLVGLLGALTTFSTFALDTLRLLDRGAGGLAPLNGLANNGLGLLVLGLGWWGAARALS